MERQHTVEVKKEEWDKLSTAEHAAICTMVMDKLVAKADELGKLFEQLITTYGMEMGAVGMSLVVNIDSVAFDDNNKFMCIGSSESILHNIKHISRDVQEALYSAVAKEEGIV